MDYDRYKTMSDVDAQDIHSYGVNYKVMILTPHCKLNEHLEVLRSTFGAEKLKCEYVSDGYEVTVEGTWEYDATREDDEALSTLLSELRANKFEVIDW